MSSSTSGRRAVARPLVVSLVLILGLVACAFGGIWWMQRSLASNIESLGDPFAGLEGRPSAGGSVDADEGGAADAMNVLVLGTDSRISAGDPSQWESGAQRTDTVMLVHVPSDRRSVVVMSIPRDSWVDVPGHGQAKINAAFSYGGPSLTIATVEQLTGVLIDHFVVTDFESFKTITDALGGVRVSLKEDLVVGNDLVPAGNQQLLTGEQALSFVRDRASLPRGDFDRMQRQQAWVRAIVAKMRNDGTMGNPLTAQRFLDTVTRSVAADDGLDAAVVNDLRGLATDVGSNDILFMTVPTLGTARSADGQSIVELDRPALGELMESVRSDTVMDYVMSEPGQFDTLPAVVD
ncbi:LCP family protein [Serinibacter arcticus]|uniref:LCP family protein n=1 Tax=Serinibacter arcticus TaxID=1655435 RepID=UPI001E2E7214|nr:LCP family protein [Serinibacter arcticus]